YEFHDYENPMTVPTYLSQLFKRLGMEDQKLEDLELLDTFKIRYLLNRNLLQLSNGERKRLQLIAAILEDPQLLIMDQPFTGLDVNSRAQLSELLEELTINGLSLILICGQSEIPDFVQKVLLLEDGKVKYRGSVEQIKAIKHTGATINTEVKVDELLSADIERFEY